MSKLWFTSDTHFGHSNIIKYDKSPFNTIEEQDEAIIDRWNNSVGKSDTVYHLGDFALSSVSHAHGILSRLNGNIHLIKGNHEKTALNPAVSCGFASISDYKEIKTGGVNLCMFHYPIHEWNRCHHGSLMLHGHTHGNDTYSDEYRRLNVGVMLHDFTPLSFDQVADLIGSKSVFKHH